MVKTMNNSQPTNLPTYPARSRGDRYGGRDPRQVAFYHSTAWLKCRDAYIKSVNGLCERCMAKGLIRPGYIVHHRTYLDPSNVNDPTYLLAWDNLEYLCIDCHNREHHGSQADKRYEFDENGNVVLLGGVV